MANSSQIRYCNADPLMIQYKGNANESIQICCVDVCSPEHNMMANSSQIRYCNTEPLTIQYKGNTNESIQIHCLDVRARQLRPPPYKWEHSHA